VNQEVFRGETSLRLCLFGVIGDVFHRGSNLPHILLQYVKGDVAGA